MTEKLYYRDSYTKEFYATVISCDKSEDGYVLTIFNSYGKSEIFAKNVILNIPKSLLNVMLWISKI